MINKYQYCLRIIFKINPYPHFVEHLEYHHYSELHQLRQEINSVDNQNRINQILYSIFSQNKEFYLSSTAVMNFLLEVAPKVTDKTVADLMWNRVNDDNFRLQLAINFKSAEQLKKILQRPYSELLYQDFVSLQQKGVIINPELAAMALDKLKLSIRTEKLLKPILNLYDLDFLLNTLILMKNNELSTQIFHLIMKRRLISAERLQYWLARISAHVVLYTVMLPYLDDDLILDQLEDEIKNYGFQRYAVILIIIMSITSPKHLAQLKLVCPQEFHYYIQNQSELLDL